LHRLAGKAGRAKSRGNDYCCSHPKRRLSSFKFKIISCIVAARHQSLLRAMP
jgi:uncharacterized protein (DUF2237 family)